jgi:peptidoglycan/LPS O-acetylase OafA/YrhL
MAADVWGEDARGIWQNQESVVTRMSADDMRARADRWDQAFRGTNWIAFACAGVLLLFFVAMLAVNETTLQHAGATIGIAAALYLVVVGVQVARWPPGDQGATCIRSYRLQLERRWLADIGSARTILLSLTGCALLTEQRGWFPWTLQAAAQLGAGVVAYVYFSRQARRFQARADELSRLEAEPRA